MPGAPNRPPDPSLPPPPPPDDPGRRALRRLAPARVALRLDIWKGRPSPELLGPFDRAEAAFAAGDFVQVEGFLDQLAVRFAEPRWPSLPAPFRELRVAIPAPMPPHWDPDHALEPAVRERKQARQRAATELALATGTLEWMRTHGLEVSDLVPRVEAASRALAGEEELGAFHAEADAFWTAVRERVPAPAPAPGAAPTARPAAREAGLEEA